MVVITVTLMLAAPTLLVVSPVLVTRATLEMDSTVQVSSNSFPPECNVSHFAILQILMSVQSVLIAVTLMLPVPTPLVASLVCVTRVTVEMDSHV